ncbi:MAG: flagellar basal-body MS-ring/collar protein FliF [Rhodocyclaceae bacterium]
MAADDALTAPPPSPWQAITDNLNKLTQRQKLAGGVALAVAIALLVGVWLWGKQPDYAVLFSNLAEKDGGQIVAALQQQNVPYKVEAGGATILVPNDRANELRLLMASQGLPKGGMVGFELMDTQKFGMSQFNEQVNYQRALEGELARTIQSIAAVGGARVHLAMPKQTAFLRDEQKPSASVVVTLRAGRRLEPQQVAGILHLVSSSVPDLSADQVSIIDQNGNLLTQKRDPRSPGLDPTQLEYVDEVEASYIKRIQTILEPVLGNGNFRAQVTADVNFDATEQTSEIYKPNPNPNTAIRSQQTADNQTNQPPAMGVPGALSNQPPTPATAPLTTPPLPGQGQSAPVVLTQSRNATTNYELDKTVQHVKRSLGAVRRLSVAVVLNYKTGKDGKGNLQATPLTDAEMKKISDLVREAVGYSQTRGDTINLANAAFAEAAKVEAPALPIWKDPEYVEYGREGLRYLVMLFAVLMVYFGVVRPLVRTVLPKPPEPTEEEPLIDVMVDDEEDSTNLDDVPPEVLEAELAKMSFERKVERAREIVQKDPKIVAQMIKEWMGGGTSGEGR